MTEVTDRICSLSSTDTASDDSTSTSATSTSPFDQALDLQRDEHDEKTPLTLAAFLEQHCFRILAYCNASDYTNPWMIEMIAPGLIDEWEHVKCESYEAHVSRMLAIRSTFPGFRLKPINAVADVQEHGTSAKVWVTVQVLGAPEGVLRESVSILSLRKRADGRWVFWRHRGLCQVAPFPF